jgi:SAM-dependent methyltransferase
MQPFLISERIDRPEYLDLGYGAPEDVAANLADMTRVNRLFGGNRGLLRQLYPRLVAQPGPATLLDLGTGSATLPAEIAAWARRRDIPVRIYALDRSARNLAVASAGTAGQAVQLVCADAARLPLREGSVDYVISSLFLHHFSPHEAVRLLRQAFDLSARGVIMNDLVRGWLPYAFSKLLNPFIFSNFLSRHDGPLSVRRSYTPEELGQLARAAGLPRPEIHTHWPWRMVLVAEK